MQPEPEARSSSPPEALEFVEPPIPQTIELLPPPARSLDLKPPRAQAPQPNSVTADSPDLPQPTPQKPKSGLFAPITATELRPARIRVGLGFVGAGAMMLLGLWAYIKLFYPEFGLTESMTHFWYPYSLSISLGVAGFFMLARESLRPQPEVELEPDDWEDGWEDDWEPEE